MAHVARLRKIGGSIVLTIPQHMLDALALGPDAAVSLSVKAGRLSVQPRRRKRYTLDELIREHNRQLVSGEHTWIGGRRMGRELL